MVDQRLAHRLRCITIKTGVINVCPDCGHHHVTDFIWDFSRDPHSELGPIIVNDETAAEFVGVLQDIAPTIACPCGCQVDDANPRFA